MRSAGDIDDLLLLYVARQKKKTNLPLAPPVCLSVSSICHETNMNEDVQFIVFHRRRAVITRDNYARLRALYNSLCEPMLHNKDLPPSVTSSWLLNFMNGGEKRRRIPLQNVFYCSYLPGICKTKSLKLRFCHKTILLRIFAHV